MSTHLVPVPALTLSPGLGLMTPFWYTLSETPIRHETWYSFNGVGGIIGDLIAFGVGHYSGTNPPQWELIFITIGTFTGLWGFWMFFMLPDSPASARFLTKEQKIIAIKRVAGNKTGTKNKVFKVEQVWEAFKDPK